MKFKYNLRKLREEHNYSQTELGKLLNISNVTISQYESGVRNPDMETLSRIADFFDVSADYLMGRNENPKLVAAHTEKDLSFDELKEVENFIDYLISKRQ